MLQSNPEPAFSLYIGNLPSDIREREIEDLVSKYGQIVSLRMINIQNIAFVGFFNESAERAIKELHLIRYGGQILHVAESTQSQKLRYERKQLSPSARPLYRNERSSYSSDRLSYRQENRPLNRSNYMKANPNFQRDRIQDFRKKSEVVQREEKLDIPNGNMYIEEYFLLYSKKYPFMYNQKMSLVRSSSSQLK